MQVRAGEAFARTTISLAPRPEWRRDEYTENDTLRRNLA
jgi:hypothetical protein